MFNIGVIGLRASGPLVKLTNRFIGLAAYPQIIFSRDGRMDISGIGYVAGEWYAPGALTDIGLSYQIRYTLQAGTAPLSFTSDTVEVSWTDINGTYGGRRIVWDQKESGRIMIEIRNKATSVVVASAQFWSKASSAP